MKKKYLSKSRFKASYDCARKLYYNEHPEYGNSISESDFMAALAEGGFQVGALAKLYFKGGVDLDGIFGEEAVLKTNELLKQKNVIIYEAAIEVDDFLVRIDVLRKTGNQVDLIEVKSKSYDFEKPFFSEIKGNAGAPKVGSKLDSDWEPYLVDVAYQTFVLNKAFPNFQVTPYLYLIDKRVTYPNDGLHQNFLIKKENNRPKVYVNQNLNPSLLEPPILSLIDVSKEVRFLIHEEVFSATGDVKLPEYAKFLSDLLKKDIPGAFRASESCKNCEFRISKSIENKGLKNGFKQCWMEAGLLDEKTKDEPTILDLWDLRRTKKIFEDNIVLLKDIPEDALGESKETESGISRVERQILQISKVRDQDPNPHFDYDHLESFFSKLKYPIHCIDFETTRSPIPFHKDMRPNAQIAYQFSHHVIHEDWRIEHKTQYLHTTPGEFPNFQFARALMSALKNDEGTILRYHNHENTVLNDIIKQLSDFKPEGHKELIDFFHSITRRKESKSDPYIIGNRCMVDLCDLVKKAYYNPKMGGSNSIKAVTPSILNHSEFLQKKYSLPIYGKKAQINSLNFDPVAWVVKDNKGNVLDPYKTLPTVEVDDGYRLTDIELINEGGGASVAWARMQFTEMSEAERSAIASGLLRYCELDTLSMVWILEYFKNSLKY